MEGNGSATNPRRGARRKLRASAALSAVALAAIAATACSTILDIKPDQITEDGKDGGTDALIRADVASDGPTDSALDCFQL